MSKDLSSVKNFASPKKFGLSIVVTAFIFYTSQFLPIIILISFLGIFGRSQTQITDLLTDNPAMQLLAITLVASTSVYLVFRYLKWRGVKPLKFLMIERKLLSKSQIGETVLTYGLYFMTLLLATIILSFVSTIDINQSQQLGLGSPESTIGLIAIFISLVVVVPISEEILFRGLLFNSLKKYGNTIVATVVVSVVFGVAHLEYGNLNWIAVVDTFIFSVYLIYISQKHRSLYSAMLLHAIKNAVAFYVLFVR